MVLSTDVWTEDSQSLHSDGEFSAEARRTAVYCVCIKVCVSVSENQGGLIECKVNYRTFAFV